MSIMLLNGRSPQRADSLQDELPRLCAEQPGLCQIGCWCCACGCDCICFYVQTLLGCKRFLPCIKHIHKEVKSNVHMMACTGTALGLQAKGGV